MVKVEIHLKVDSTRETEMFYCDELGLFEFDNDYGMGTISLILKENPFIRLLLSTGVSKTSEDYLFGIETKDCENLFKKLKHTQFKTEGKLISDEVFEYPLGKSFEIKDPSRNRFLIFEDYKP